MKKPFLIFCVVGVPLLAFALFLKLNEFDLSDEMVLAAENPQRDHFVFFIAADDTLSLVGSPKAREKFVSPLLNLPPLIGVPFLRFSPEAFLIATGHSLFSISPRGAEKVFTVEEGLIADISFDTRENAALVMIRKDETHMSTIFLSPSESDGDTPWTIVKTIPSAFMSGDAVSKRMGEWCDNLQCRLSGTLASPDGTRTLVAATNAYPFVSRYTLSVLSNGKTDTLFTETSTAFGGNLDSVEWLSDSRHVLVTVFKKGTRYYYVFDTDTGQGFLVGTGDAIQWIELPSFSS